MDKKTNQRLFHLQARVLPPGMFDVMTNRTYHPTMVEPPDSCASVSISGGLEAVSMHAYLMLVPIKEALSLGFGGLAGFPCLLWYATIGWEIGICTNGKIACS